MSKSLNCGLFRRLVADRIRGGLLRRPRGRRRRVGTSEESVEYQRCDNEYDHRSDPPSQNAVVVFPIPYLLTYVFAHVVPLEVVMLRCGAFYWPASF